MSAHAAVGLTRCPNCGRDLDGRFCAGCGQKVTPLNPSLHDFVHDLTHELLHVDGTIFQTVRLLLTRPGFLTREYFEGRRARYVSPIRLYLIFSVAYFAVAAVAPGSDPTVKSTGDVKLQELGFESEAAFQAAVNRALRIWTPRVMFVLVPVFAVLVKLVTRRSGRNYPQHLYFAFHIHAAGFALLAVAALARFARSPGWVTETIELAAMVGLFVYVVLAFRRAYGGTAARAVRRAAVVGLLYLVAVGLALAAIIVPLILPALSVRSS